MPDFTTAGIVTIGCKLCEFEFVFVVPEEADLAILQIMEHLHDVHNSTLIEAPPDVIHH